MDGCLETRKQGVCPRAPFRYLVEMPMPGIERIAVGLHELSLKTAVKIFGFRHPAPYSAQVCITVKIRPAVRIPRSQINRAEPLQDRIQKALRLCNPCFRQQFILENPFGEIFVAVLTSKIFHGVGIGLAVYLHREYPREESAPRSGRWA